MTQIKLNRAFLLLCALIVAVTGCSRSTDEEDAPALRRNDGVLQFVPADTPYVFATPESMPDDVVDKLEANADSMYSAYATIIDATMSDMVANLEGEGVDEEETARIMTLAGEVAGLMRSDRLRAAGVPRSPKIALYGVGLLPVLRVELSDPAAFDAQIEKFEESAGEEMSLGEIEGQAYRYLGDDEARLIVALIDEYLVATIVPTPLSPQQLAAVLGLELPAESIAQSGALAELADAYGFTSYGLGYFDVQRIASTFIDPASGVNAELLTLMDFDAGTLSDVCRDEIRSMSAVMPRLVTGYTEITTTKIGSNTVFELRSDLAKGLTGLTAPVPGMGADHGGLGSFGMSLNLLAAREFYESRLDALDAAPFKCEHFGEMQGGLEQGRQALKQPLPPIVYGFRGFLAVVDDIEGIDFATQQPPTSIDLRFLVANDNAEGLLAMGAMFSPELAALDLKTDGKPMKLDLPQIPEQFDGAYVAMTESALAVAIGDASASRLGSLLDSAAGDPPPFVSMHLDGARYYALMSDALKAGVSAPGANANEVTPEMQEALSQVMTGIGKMIDRISVDVTLTERGIELPATITLLD